VFQADPRTVGARTDMLRPLQDTACSTNSRKFLADALGRAFASGRSSTFEVVARSRDLPAAMREAGWRGAALTMNEPDVGGLDRCAALAASVEAFETDADTKRWVSAIAAKDLEWVERLRRGARR
jgi:hypothetical protein